MKELLTIISTPFSTDVYEEDLVIPSCSQYSHPIWNLKEKSGKTEDSVCNSTLVIKGQP